MVFLTALIQLFESLVRFSTHVVKLMTTRAGQLVAMTWFVMAMSLLSMVALIAMIAMISLMMLGGI